MSLWIVMGAGQFARVALSHLRGVECCVVDDEHLKGELVYLDGVPVRSRSTLLAWEGRLDLFRVVNAITSPARTGLADALRDKGFYFGTFVHPAAWAHGTVVLNGGAFVNAGAVLDHRAFLGFCALVNRGATVGHDAWVGDCATVGPGAHLAGNAVVGDRAFVGMGACVLEGRAVGAGAVIGAGAVVLEDVPPGETWAGVPARRIG